ncbi:hypothetical protein Dda_3419 [Drechslerella dactyloides]|uniref:Uncharacterized protein n=1 Tax=Drechslerella dactyloides TaxID=74499 RepID=A0AAD6J1B8_DREDA|nr:hypothetical protein Dda_3419 [Drechslerella dactyloides]
MADARSQIHARQRDGETMAAMERLEEFKIKLDDRAGKILRLVTALSSGDDLNGSTQDQAVGLDS